MRYLLLLALALLGAEAQSVQARMIQRDLGWTEHRNSRLGFSLSYPARVFRLDQTTEAGDGELFVSPDGSAQLLVGGFENTDRHSPSSYQRYIARRSYPEFEIDYSPVGQSWSVLSGQRESMMFYEKAIFSCRGSLITSFALTYPVSQRGLYDPIIEHIEDTFRVSSVECS